MTQKIPPEFAEYYTWMRKNNYTEYQKKKHIQHARRIGYLLLNSEFMTPDEIAEEMCNGVKSSEYHLRWTVNDYRHFLDSKTKRERQQEILMTLQDKVLV